MLKLGYSKDLQYLSLISLVQPVYVICHKDWKEEVSNRIKAKALGDYGKSKNNFRTKECVLLNGSLAGKHYRNTVGWLELDNGYFFFTDKEMFHKVCTLFGLNEGQA